MRQRQIAIHTFLPPGVGTQKRVDMTKTTQLKLTDEIDIRPSNTTNGNCMVGQIEEINHFVKIN
jgi:hypothetical protein